MAAVADSCEGGESQVSKVSVKNESVKAMIHTSPLHSDADHRPGHPFAEII